MSSNSERATQRIGSSPVVPALYAVAIIIGAVSVIAALFQLGSLLSRTNPAVGIDEIVSTVMMAVGGAAAALLLAGIAAIIGYLQMQAQLLSRITRAQEDAVSAINRLQPGVSAIEDRPAAPAAVPVGGHETGAALGWMETQRLEQISDLLHEINENVLLTPEQRQAKRREQLDAMHRQLGQTLGDLLTTGKFVEAQQRLDAYAQSFPDEARKVEQFQCRIDEARAKAEETDYQQAAVRVRELAGMAAWDRAEETVQALAARHPRSARVRAMVVDLREERTRFEQLQRQHTLAQIEQCAARKEHREAHRMACELLSRFPESPEAQSLRGKLDTLRDNAEIAIRKDLEEQFKELMRVHRYIEALALAQDIMAKYPGSPQAKALKEGLPALMGKAKLQMEQG